MDTNVKRSIFPTGTELIQAVCFLGGGWTLLSRGYNFVGSLCLVMAVVWPTIHGLLSRYLKHCDAQHRDAVEREMADLRELAEREAQRLSNATTVG